MIYTDGIYVFSADLKKLHAFGKQMQLDHCWYRKNEIECYKLSSRKCDVMYRLQKFKEALRLGAKIKTTNQILALIKKK